MDFTMISKMDRAGVALTLALVVGLSACGSAPTEELDAARMSVDAATAAAAQDYAPEAMEPVMAVQMELETELAAQSERFALTRSYERAEALADSVKALADAAAVRAAEAKAEMQRTADSLMVVLTSELADTRMALSTAPRGKGSATDLAALAGDLDGVGTILEEARGAYGASDYKGAMTKLQAAQQGIQGVRTFLAGGATASAAGGTF